MVKKLNVQLVNKIKQINPGYVKGAIQTLKNIKETRQCNTKLGPRCTKIDDEACYPIKRYSQCFKTTPKGSVWNEPECFNFMDCDQPTRYDDMYWKHTDKNNREYAQTWVDYPKPQILPKICLADVLKDVEPLEKRTKDDIRKLIDVQTVPPQCVKLDLPCPKFKMAHCAPARVGDCAKTRVASKMKKLCAPFPSYADIARRIPKNTKRHCEFETAASICDMKVEEYRLKTIKKVPHPNECIC